MTSKILFVGYPKCSTSNKAQKWLDSRGVSYEFRHIVEKYPTERELRTWHKRSGLPLKRFFNTSGMLYREMELSKKLPDMTEDEMYALLATNGMLVKRPLLVLNDTVLPGFKEADWEQALQLDAKA
jgi:arsenate reductase